MKKYSILLTISSVVLIRIFVYLISLTSYSTNVYSDNWHHYYLGLILLIISFYVSNLKFTNFRIALYSISIGLIVDEVMLPLALLGVWPWGYWHLITIFTMIGALLIYIYFYEKIVNKIFRK